MDNNISILREIVKRWHELSDTDYFGRKVLDFYEMERAIDSVLLGRKGKVVPKVHERFRYILRNEVLFWSKDTVNKFINGEITYKQASKGMVIGEYVVGIYLWSIITLEWIVVGCGLSLSLS